MFDGQDRKYYTFKLFYREDPLDYSTAINEYIVLSWVMLAYVRRSDLILFKMLILHFIQALYIVQFVLLN